ncbi:MAG: pentapeptide repeat-containing protein, partial [Pseudomonadota bacterium]
TGVDLRWHVLALVGLITAFGALVSAPLALVRIIISERQTKTAEARRDYDDRTLVNQRIQGALQQLGARYNRTRMGRTVTHGAKTKRVSVLEWEDEPGTLPEKLTNPEFTDWAPVVFSEPDTQARLAAIGEMQAMVTEHPDKRRAINEHLANFIRANAPIEPSEVEDPEKKPKVAPDIQAAISLIGRSTKNDEIAGLDLRSTNLAQAELQRAFLENANLRGAQLRGANLRGAQLQRANLSEAQLQEASLYRAQLDGANLDGAQLQEASLYWARLEGANLDGARLEGADLSQARLEGANLFRARLEGANLFGARLEGANLSQARLEGADLSKAQFDEKTDFTGAIVQCTAVRSVDLTDVDLTQDQINSIFGDATTTPPKGMEPPSHWSEDDLEYTPWKDDGGPFHKAWRAWQKSQGYDPGK